MAKDVPSPKDTGFTDKLVSELGFVLIELAKFQARHSAAFAKEQAEAKKRVIRRLKAALAEAEKLELIAD